MLELDKYFGYSPFFVIKNNGTNYITSGLGFLISQGTDVKNPKLNFDIIIILIIKRLCWFFKFVYTGSNKMVRGIPVNEWQTCFYTKQDQTTYKITASFSGEFKKSKIEDD